MTSLCTPEYSRFSRACWRLHQSQSQATSSQHSFKYVETSSRRLVYMVATFTFNKVCRHAQLCELAGEYVKKDGRIRNLLKMPQVLASVPDWEVKDRFFEQKDHLHLNNKDQPCYAEHTRWYEVRALRAQLHRPQRDNVMTEPLQRPHGWMLHFRFRFGMCIFAFSKTCRGQTTQLKHGTTLSLRWWRIIQRSISSLTSYAKNRPLVRRYFIPSYMKRRRLTNR